MKALAIAVLTGVVLIVTGTQAAAANFHATLSSIKLQARPGQVITRSLQLTLDDDQAPTHFKIHVEDWWRSEDGVHSFYGAAGGLKRSCATWVSVNPVEAAVEPGGTLNIRVTINVPAALGGGGYWCALTIDEVPDPLARPEGVRVRFLASASTGVFVYLDPVERAAHIVDVALDGKTASVKVTNDGNAPIPVEGRVEFLRPGDDTPVAVAKLARGTLLPEPIRSGIFTVPLPDAATLPSGSYLVRAIIDIGLDHYLGVQRELVINRESAAR